MHACRLYLKENPMSFIILFLILSNELKKMPWYLLLPFSQVFNDM